jgi:GNAT superfamily N-acetyltransferase
MSTNHKVFDIAAVKGSQDFTLIFEHSWDPGPDFATRELLGFPVRALDANQSLIGRQTIEIDPSGEIDIPNDLGDGFHAFGGWTAAPVAIGFHALLFEIGDSANCLVHRGLAASILVDREGLMPDRRGDNGLEMAASSMQIRLAQTGDIPALHCLIEASVRGLQAADYTSAQIEGALGGVLGLDTQLIADQTYFLAEWVSGQESAVLVGCGGWSFRKMLFGSDHGPGRAAALLDPEREPARIRAIFVHPAWARRGIGSLILEQCEAAAGAAGFHRLEMGSTLTGVPLYSRKGYRELERIAVPLPNGETLPVVRMGKDLE